jgi:RNA polymerase sigma factor (sigma-70 family)
MAGRDRMMSAVEEDQVTSPGSSMVPSRELEVIYRENGSQLARAIYAYSGGRKQVAEDAVAEAFARALASTRELRQPLAWIYRTAFRIATRELERERRPLPSLPDAVPGIDPFEIQDVLQALAQLTHNQRAAVLLHDEEGLTAPEVARLLGMSAATVRVHLFRARKHLRTLLSSEEEDDV